MRTKFAILLLCFSLGFALSLFFLNGETKQKDLLDSYDGEYLEEIDAAARGVVNSVDNKKLEVKIDEQDQVFYFSDQFELPDQLEQGDKIVLNLNFDFARRKFFVKDVFQR